MPLTNTVALALKSATTNVDVSAATAPSSGQVLTATGTTAATWQTPSGGTAPITYATIFETGARFNQITSGGTITFGTSGVVLDTTATGTRYANLQLQLGGSGGQVRVFAGNPTFTSAFMLANAAGADPPTSYIGIGDVTVAGTGHTFTTNHIGFKTVRASNVDTLWATNANGTTETATSLVGLGQNDHVEVKAIVTSGSQVLYYYRRNGAATFTLGATHTTNIPDSTTTSYLLQWSVSNNSVGTAMSIRVASASYER